MTPRAPTTIRQEIRQSRPLAGTAQEAVLGVLRTGDLLRRHFAALLKPYGITPQQYNVLRILRGAGKGGIPTLDIAERMIEHQPGITRLLDRLEASGWARRERCVEDRRQVLCYITAAGLTLLGRLDEPVLAGNAEAMAALRPAEHRQLAALLDRLRAGVREAIAGG